MSLKIIRDETGVYVEIPRDKIKFVSKEAKIMFDLSMENDYLENENEEYKLNHKQLKDLDKIQKSFIELKNQQKEFIKYMRELSNWYSADGARQGLVNEILQKYKQIIGVLDE